jgi:hypothetical protein
MHISLDSALGRQRRLNSVGESVFQIAPDAAAGYSLRSLTGGDPAVVRVRRESDNNERDFRSSEINSGGMVRWVNEQITPPLDLRELTATGRDGPIIEAAAAYSLRNLSDSYTGDVVEVRRNTDGALKDFKASEVTDGTLEAWVNTSFANALPLDTASGAAAAYSLRNLSSSYTGSVVEVRRSSDDAVRSFTAAEVTDSTLLDWVLSEDADILRFADAGLSGSPAADKRMYFDGVNDGISTGTVLVPATGDFEITYTCQIPSGFNPADNRYVVSQYSPGTTGRFLVGVGTGGKAFLGIASQSVVSTPSINDGAIHHIKATRVGNTFTLFVDDVSQGTFTFAGSIENRNTEIGQNTSLSRYFKGLIYDLNIAGTEIDGYGITSSDWNGYTINGSPVLFTGQGFDGTVSKWYDQSGNDNHATQGTPASQPKIVDGGALVTGGLDFNNDFLVASSVSGLTGSLSMFSLSERDFSGNVVSLSNSSNSGRYFSIQEGGSSSTVNTRNPTPVNVYGNVSSSTRLTFALTTGATSTSVGANGSAVTTTSDDYGDDFSGTDINQIAIGLLRTVSPTGYFNGRIKEVIVYNTDQSSKRRAIEENIGSTYGITLPSSKDGTVSKWYDQSTASGVSNNRHAVQTSAGSQPKIVDGGTLVSGGLDFSGGAKHLDFTPFSATNETIFVQSSTRLTNAFSTILSGADNRAVLSQTSSSVSYNVTAGAFASISAASVEGKQLFTFNRDGTNVNCYQNGGLLGSNTTYANSSIQRSVIGRRGNTEGNYGGSIQEIIIYDTDQTDNRTALEANIGEVYGIAGIPAYEDTVNGFVETWYDQSGNGNDATQLTAGSQPKIVDAGTLEKDANGKPEMVFDGSNDWLDLGVKQLGNTEFFADSSDSWFITAVATYSGGTLISKAVSNNVEREFQIFYNLGQNTVNARGGHTDFSADTDRRIISFNWDGSNAVAGANGASTTVNVGSAAKTNQNINIGSRTNGGFPLNGSIQEIIVYDSDQTSNRPAIEANINNQYDIY